MPSIQESESRSWSTSNPVHGRKHWGRISEGSIGGRSIGVGSRKEALGSGRRGSIGVASRHSTHLDIRQLARTPSGAGLERDGFWQSQMSDRTKRQDPASLNRVAGRSSSRPAARLVASPLVSICRRPFPALWPWPLSRSLPPHLGPPVCSPGFSRRRPGPAKAWTPSPRPQVRSLLQRRSRRRESAHYSRPGSQRALTSAATVQGFRLGPCSRNPPHGQDSSAACPSQIAHLRCWGRVAGEVGVNISSLRDSLGIGSFLPSPTSCKTPTDGRPSLALRPAAFPSRSRHATLRLLSGGRFRIADPSSPSAALRRASGPGGFGAHPKPTTGSSSTQAKIHIHRRRTS
jgi:hypothetical protein